MKTLMIIGNWFNDSGDVQIVQLKPIDSSRELQKDLFWYSGNHRPMWKAGTKLTDEEVLATKCYKMKKMVSVEQDIPNDCYAPLF
mgnify:CR=1 FL=1